MPDHAATLAQAQEKVETCESLDALKSIEREYLGKDGLVAELLAQIPTLANEERPAAGREANLLKQAILKVIEARRTELADANIAAERSGQGFDPSLPPPRVQRGTLHPITQVTRELEDLFQSMGYSVLDGPEVELDYYNFEALQHPRRPPRPGQPRYIFLRGRRETWSCEPIPRPSQIRAMESFEPPFRVVAPGKCFRHETTDASHDHTFHQMEGLVVDRDISVAHLIGAMKTLLRGIFHRDLEVRLRPGHFPFVEPGFELDARCPFCDEGCSVCKRTTWIELLPCGLVHPNVLRPGGLDPEEWGGFAFGLGLSRLVMLHHDIDDVRHLLANDVRFLEQF